MSKVHRPAGLAAPGIAPCRARLWSVRLLRPDIRTASAIATRSRTMGCKSSLRAMAILIGWMERFTKSERADLQRQSFVLLADVSCALGWTKLLARKPPLASSGNCTRLPILTCGSWLCATGRRIPDTSLPERPTGLGSVRSCTDSTYVVV